LDPKKYTDKQPLDDPPQLNEEEIAVLRQDIPEGTTGFIGEPDEAWWKPEAIRFEIFHALFSPLMFVPGLQ